LGGLNGALIGRFRPKQVMVRDRPKTHAWTCKQPQGWRGLTGGGLREWGVKGGHKIRMSLRMDLCVFFFCVTQLPSLCRHGENGSTRGERRRAMLSQQVRQWERPHGKDVVNAKPPGGPRGACRRHYHALACRQKAGSSGLLFAWLVRCFLLCRTSVLVLRTRPTTLTSSRRPVELKQRRAKTPGECARS
jgi:hypothetical protein